MPVVLCLSFLSSTSFAAPTDTWNESFQRLSDELARARRNIVSNIGIWARRSTVSRAGCSASST